MKNQHKHPQIFSDMLQVCQVYYPMHNSFPKTFRFAVGERILSECAECLRAIVLANAVDKKTYQGCVEGSAQVRRVRAGLEVIRGFLLMAWKMRFLSHGGISGLLTHIESVSKQAARWQQWFDQQQDQVFASKC